MANKQLEAQNVYGKVEHRKGPAIYRKAKPMEVSAELLFPHIKEKRVITELGAGKQLNFLAGILAALAKRGRTLKPQAVDFIDMYKDEGKTREAFKESLMNWGEKIGLGEEKMGKLLELSEELAVIYGDLRRLESLETGSDAWLMRFALKNFLREEQEALVKHIYSISLKEGVFLLYEMMVWRGGLSERVVKRLVEAATIERYLKQAPLLGTPLNSERLAEMLGDRGWRFAIRVDVGGESWVELFEKAGWYLEEYRQEPHSVVNPLDWVSSKQKDREEVKAYVVKLIGLLEEFPELRSEGGYKIKGIPTARELGLSSRGIKEIIEEGGGKLKEVAKEIKLEEVEIHYPLGVYLFKKR